MAKTFKCLPTIREFVKLVEKNPCIYNDKIPEYICRQTTAKAWKQIASEMGIPVRECKEKWRHIRVAFSSTLKENRVHPYYLADHLRFLLPFLKAYKDSEKDLNEQPSSSKTPPSYTISEEEEEKEYTKQEITDEENTDNDDYQDPLDNTDSESGLKTETIPMDISYDRRQNFKRKSSTNERQDSFEIPVVSKKRYVKPECMKSEAIEDNPRKMFLLSIMPDIEELTDDEMRVFRRDVVTSIDRIISSRGK